MRTTKGALSTSDQPERRVLYVSYGNTVMEMACRDGILFEGGEMVWEKVHCNVDTCTCSLAAESATAE